MTAADVLAVFRKRGFVFGLTHEGKPSVSPCPTDEECLQLAAHRQGIVDILQRDADSVLMKLYRPFPPDRFVARGYVEWLRAKQWA